MVWGHLSSKMNFSPNRFAFCTSLVQTFPFSAATRTCLLESQLWSRHTRASPWTMWTSKTFFWHLGLEFIWLSMVKWKILTFMKPKGLRFPSISFLMLNIPRPTAHANQNLSLDTREVIPNHWSLIWLGSQRRAFFYVVLYYPSTMLTSTYLTSKNK